MIMQMANVGSPINQKRWEISSQIIRQCKSLNGHLVIQRFYFSYPCLSLFIPILEANAISRMESPMKREAGWKPMMKDSSLSFSFIVTRDYATRAAYRECFVAKRSCEWMKLVYISAHFCLCVADSFQQGTGSFFGCCVCRVVSSLATRLSTEACLFKKMA